MNSKFIVEQKITAFANKYSIYEASAEGEKQQLLAFAQQKRVALKEKISFYSDRKKSNLAFTLQAEKVMDVHGRYFVADANGNRIGAFKKEFVQSLTNSTWNILDDNGQPRIVVQESNSNLALMRRYGSMIPLVGGLVELVTNFLKYHFDFVDTATNQKIGRYEKKTLFKDHYVLSMQDEIYQQTDWRLLVSVAVALDALQSR